MWQSCMGFSATRQRGWSGSEDPVVCVLHKMGGWKVQERRGWSDLALTSEWRTRKAWIPEMTVLVSLLGNGMSGIPKGRDWK